MEYLTFAEYTELGGTVTEETTFKSLQRKVESKLNYVTFGRLEKMYEEGSAPEDEVKKFEVDMINATHTSNPDDIKYGIQSYSNGIESFTNLSYAKNEDADSAYSARLYRKAQEYLWKYPELFYRGRR